MMLPVLQQLRASVASLLPHAAPRPLTSLSQHWLRLQPQQTLAAFHTCTPAAGSRTVEDVQEQIDNVNDKFTDARMDIEDAREDAESTYFNESAETAAQSVAEAISAYKAICDSLTDFERGKLQRSMGLKMEQLKAELQQLNELHT
ncbi:hypothetical protein WJX72_005320 [[Myrmecia] bisecta]|uniref:Late embryogenesis abundant protein n=1 Tax=[Myrmecia] bisecta TaxID=41462 RepID=A0AAW1Q3N2_9CHLO